VAANRWSPPMPTGSPPCRTPHLPKPGNTARTPTPAPENPPSRLSKLENSPSASSCVPSPAGSVAAAAYSSTTADALRISCNPPVATRQDRSRWLPTVGREEPPTCYLDCIRHCVNATQPHLDPPIPQDRKSVLSGLFS